MNVDARLTLYGGAGFGSALVAIGAITTHTLVATGLGLMAAGLAVALAIERVADDPPPQPF